VKALALLLWFASLPACDAAPDPEGSDPDLSGALSGDAGDPGDAAAGDLGDPTACASDSVDIDGVCMDRYEAPNQAGASPLPMQSALSGESWCAMRGKRLCSEAEWVRACEGPSGRPYPYGQSYARGTCNDDKTWISPNWTVLGTFPSDPAVMEVDRLYQGDPSGSRSGCVSEEGVMDLTGNVAEWVRRSFDHANNYPHVMKGCYWAGCYGGSNPSCAFTNPAHPSGFRSYEAGFRCCRDHLPGG